MITNKINHILDSLGFDDHIVPIDGVAVALLTYYLSPPGSKLNNTLIIGGSHYLLHSFLVRRMKRCSKYKPISNKKKIYSKPIANNYNKINRSTKQFLNKKKYFNINQN